jgi:hypothetical protein
MSQVDGTGPGFSNVAAAANSGTITYNGTGCNCTAFVSTSRVETTPPGSANWIFTINSALFGQLLLATKGIYGWGAFGFPFALPDTGGMNDTITVFAHSSAAANGTSDLVSANFSGSIANT